MYKPIETGDEKRTTVLDETAAVMHADVDVMPGARKGEEGWEVGVLGKGRGGVDYVGDISTGRGR